MRSIWKGSISFGLVNVPVKLYAATEDHDLPMHQVHDKDSGRIRYERKCEVCGEVVAYQHISKAYDDGEHTVVLTADDFAALPSEHSREIEIVQFVPENQVDPIAFDHAYFLEPDASGAKPYALLRRTLEESDALAIATFALRQRTRLAAVRVHGPVLMVQTLLWADEVREMPAPEGIPRVSAAELEMSAKLVEAYSGDFTPDKFTDDYQAELKTLVEAKLREGDALDTAATFGEPEESDAEDGGKVIDLMEALRKSVEKSRGSKKSSEQRKKSG